MDSTQANPEAGDGIQLSVLIVTYNSSSTIRDCLHSVFEATADLDSEVIIVDNASSDGTQDILHEFEGKQDSLQVLLNSSNRGFAAGNNQALAAAKGQDVLILNPDTIPEKESIVGLIHELHISSNIALVAPQLRFPDGRLQKTCRRFPKYRDVIFHSLGLAQLFPQVQLFNGWKMGDFDHQSRRKVDQPAGAALLIRGRVLRDLQGFDLSFPMFFNDVDLCRRIHDAGYEVWYLPEYKITHIGGASVKQVKAKMVVSSHISFFRYFEKHFTRLHQQSLNFFIAILLYLSLIPRLLALLIRRPKDEPSRDTL